MNGPISQNAKKVKDVLDERAHLPSNFCLVPFTTIILEPDGAVGMCRHHGYNFAIGNVKHNTISEIWNGEKARNWRKEFLTNNVQICKDFVRERRCHLSSHFNAILPHTDFSEIQNSPILKLTANFNGKCNLRCQMCSIWKLPNGFYTEENFWKDARVNIFPHLKDIDLLSGEPFIQEDTFKLIEEVSTVNPDCQWNFTTNVHWDFDERIKDSLSKIKIRSIAASIDSLIPDVYNKIRYPGNLSIVLVTLDKLIAFRESRTDDLYFDLSFNVTVQKDNWREIPEMINFSLKHKMHPYFFILKVPTEFSVLTLEIKERIEIIDFYFKSVEKENLKHIHTLLYPLIYSLEKIDQAAYFSLMKESMQPN